MMIFNYEIHNFFSRFTAYLGANIEQEFTTKNFKHVKQSKKYFMTGQRPNNIMKRKKYV